MTRAACAVALGLGLCLVAGAFAATPLYVPGGALVLSGATAVAWVRLSARNVEVRRSLDRVSVQEGSPLHVDVFLGCARVPLPGPTLRAWDGGPPLPLPPLRARRRAATAKATAKATATIRLQRRGRHRLAPATMSLSDPLGLCQRTVASSPDDVLVLPRLEPVELIGLGADAGRAQGPAAVDAVAGATDVDSLQPHRPGTPASRIHWPTVARTATLMERRLVAGGDYLPVVAVDARGASSPDAFDQAIRAAASLCIHLGRRGGCTLLLPGDPRPARIDAELSGFAAAHARLALIETDAGAPAMAGEAGGGPVIWVSAAASAWAPPTADYLVSPHAQARWPARFRVAGCRGYEIEGRAAARLAL